MTFLAIIPARKNSKRVKNKNMSKINNKPLIGYTFDQVKKTKYLDKIIVSTDSETIRDYAINANIEVPFLRPKNISKDSSSSYSVVKHAHNFFKRKNNFNFKYIILLQPTSPLRKAFHIDEACKKMLKNPNADCLISTCRISNIINGDLVMKKNSKYLSFGNYQKYLKLNHLNSKLNISNSIKSFEKNYNNLFIRNGPAILILKTKNINNFFIDGNILDYEMSLEYSLDINTGEDLKKFKKIIHDKKK